MRYRSVLFVPCANARALEKARGLTPDAVILDLEDAVGAEERDGALMLTAQALRDGFAAPAVMVRIHPGSLNAIHRALHGLKIDGIVVPKVDGPEDLRAVAHLWPDMPIWAMIETARGVARLADIAAEPLAGLITGPNDLRRDLRTRPLPGRADIATALSQIVLHGRANGLVVLDGVYNPFRDEAGFAADCAHGRALGFDGKTLIHPAQIDPCNRAFSPSDEDIAWAEAVVAAFAGSDAGVVPLDGQMVERLHLDIA
ncbi:MAG: HpcH/HpaI aldolase/citrate lyase family protein, partial [Asticcacaulis sp.]